MAERPAANEVRDPRAPRALAHRVRFFMWGVPARPGADPEEAS